MTEPQLFVLIVVILFVTGMVKNALYKRPKNARYGTQEPKTDVLGTSTVICDHTDPEPAFMPGFTDLDPETAEHYAAQNANHQQWVLQHNEAMGAGALNYLYVKEEVKLPDNWYQEVTSGR